MTRLRVFCVLVTHILSIVPLLWGRINIQFVFLSPSFFIYITSYSVTCKNRTTFCIFLLRGAFFTSFCCTYTIIIVYFYEIFNLVVTTLFKKIFMDFRYILFFNFTESNNRY